MSIGQRAVRPDVAGVDDIGDMSLTDGFQNLIASV